MSEDKPERTRYALERRPRAFGLVRHWERYTCECEREGVALNVAASPERVPCPYCCPDQFKAHRGGEDR